MTEGTVKCFNAAEGSGFITPEKGGAEMSAHYPAVQAKGFPTLEEKQRVSFEEAQSPRGPQAANVNQV